MSADAEPEATELLAALIGTPSVNPDIEPGGAGEAPIAGVVADWLTRAGFEVALVGRDPQRPSVVAVRRGSGGGRTILLNGHLDTVGVAGYGGNPYDARVEAGRMHGRGSYDMKGGVAAAMVAARRATERGLRGDVVLTLVADEEFASIGTEDALAALDGFVGRQIDGAIVVEPTGLELTVAHRGFAWFRLDLEGTPAHGSQPHLGEDAIVAATDVLVALRALGDRLGAARAHPLLGASTVRVAMIDGGTDAATVAARASLTIERRTLPDETPEAVRAELATVVATALSTPVADGAAAGIRHRLTELVSRSAFETPEGAAIAGAVSSAFERTTGRPVVRRGDPWWTDAGLLAEAGIPSVLLGAAGGGAHAREEWVELASIDTLTAVLEHAIVDFCG